MGRLRGGSVRAGPPGKGEGEVRPGPRWAGLGWGGSLGLGWVDFGCGFAFYFPLSNSNKV